MTATQTTGTPVNLGPCGCCPSPPCAACTIPGMVYVTLTGSPDPDAVDGTYALPYLGTDGFGRRQWYRCPAPGVPGWCITFSCGFAVGKDFGLDILVSTLLEFRRYVSGVPGPTDLTCDPFSATHGGFQVSIDGRAYTAVAGMAGVVTP